MQKFFSKNAWNNDTEDSNCIDRDLIDNFKRNNEELKALCYAKKTINKKGIKIWQK